MKKLRKYIPYLFLVLYIAVIFISPPKYINYPKLLVMNVISFPLSFFNNIFYDITFVVRSRSIIEENKILYNKVQELQNQVVQTEELKSENERLKGILSFKETSPLSFIACPIIAKDSSSLSNTIIIKGGKKQGIKPQTIVVVSSGVIGRVIESNSYLSRVLLITDPNSKVSAIDNRSRCEGMLYGISQGYCKLVYLPLNADIKKGDKIVTSGFSSFYPKGLALGTVVLVEKSAGGLSLQAIVKPEFDLFKIEEALCIK